MVREGVAMDEWKIWYVNTHGNGADLFNQTTTFRGEEEKVNDESNPSYLQDWIIHAAEPLGVVDVMWKPEPSYMKCERFSILSLFLGEVIFPVEVLDGVNIVYEQTTTLVVWHPKWYSRDKETW